MKVLDTRPLLSNDIKDYLATVVSISTISEMVVQIEKAIRDPHSSAGKVGEIIANDQAISSKILKLVNSAFYGFPKKITNIPHAIVILGFENVRNTALSISVISNFSNDEGGLIDFKELWRHAIAVAMISRLTAKILKIGNPEDIFMAGLLHDLGKVICADYMKEEFTGILEQVRGRDGVYYETELAMLGYTHAEIGEYVADKWNLPQSLSRVIGNHHTPFCTKSCLMEACIVHLSDIAARGLDLGSGGDTRMPPIDSRVEEILSINTQFFETLFAQTGAFRSMIEEYIEIIQS